MATKAKKRPPEEEAPPIRPNMLMLNADGRSSSIAQSNFSHSIVGQTKFFNSRFHQSNFEATSWDECDFDGSTFTACSFAGAEFVDCDVEQLVINGINIGNLMRLMRGEGGTNG